MNDISSRNTVSNKIPKIDSLYVYKTSRRSVKFNRHLNAGLGYRYMVGNAILKAGQDEMYDYHRTVKIDGTEHGLVMITKNSKFKEVQKWFNEKIKEIESNNKLLTTFKSAKSSPQELGLYYIY